MKNFIFPILLSLITSNSLARECSLHEIKGRVVSFKDHLEIVLAEKSVSEKRFRIPLMEEPRFAPYVGSDVKGLFVLELQKIVFIESFNRDFPDPAQDNKHSYMKKIKVTKCP